MLEEFVYFINIQILLIFVKYLILLFNIILLFFFNLNNTFKNKITIKDKENYENIKIKINKEIKIKVCICTLGKKENKYIKEYVEYYKKIGIDKIFLYDNNEIDGENFDDVLHDYITNKFVDLINYRGKIAPQFKIFTDCYKNNNKRYDWLIFYDIDEFINLKNYSNIKYFLNEKKFDKCKSIYLNCIRHTDNDLLFYDNRSLGERFPIINWNSNMYTVKTIIRGNLKGVTFKTSHWLDRNIIGCNAFGKFIKPNKNVKMEMDYNDFNDSKLYYIDHYCYKSTEEYINKINKGDGIFGYNNKTRIHKINLYFKYNTITMAKIIYIEKKTGFNLSQYKLKFYKNKLIL